MSTKPPACPDDIAPHLLAEAKEKMYVILEREPQLGDFGLGVFDPRHKTPGQRDAELRQARRDIQTPRSLAAFIATRQWLRQFRKIKSPNKRGTSYGLKHRAEADIGYITNGVFNAISDPVTRTRTRMQIIHLKGLDMNIVHGPHRFRLPNRRHCETATLTVDGMPITATIGFDCYRNPAEVFLNAGKPGSTIDGLLGDAAVAISVALQCGVKASMLAKSVGRLDTSSSAASAIGAALDLVASFEQL